MGSIPAGFCQCGCGKPTAIAQSTKRARGQIKGHPLKYATGHRSTVRAYREDSHIEPPNPSGVCLCGCGKSTPIAPRTSSYAGWVAGHPVRFCNGHGVKNRTSRSRDLVIRFWEKVQKSAEPDGCWEWQATLKKGYGSLSVGTTMQQAHRVSWQLHYGPIPTDLQVLHKCDNRSCVRPDHLFLGTLQDNMHDRDQKHRQARGERIHRASLTADAVRKIRALVDASRDATGAPKAGIRAQLATVYHVSPSAIDAVVRRKNWRHIE